MNPYLLLSAVRARFRVLLFVLGATVLVTTVVSLLALTCADSCHEFWPDDASFLDSRLFHHAHIHGHRQVTDLYLLALAVRHSGRLITFDGKIPLSAVHGAKKQHVLVL